MRCALHPQAPTADLTRRRVAYLFSRWPVLSHTFADNEVLGLERAGWAPVICVIHPSEDPLRHPRLDHLRAPVLHAPPPAQRRRLQQVLTADGCWPGELVRRHEREFGEAAKPELRCRNAASFAAILPAMGVEHVHVHFANRATHSAIFLKHLTGIPFSFTPQGQDFLVDLGCPALFREMCAEAAFVVAPCDWARERILEMAPAAEDKVVRIYNGVFPQGYPQASPRCRPLRIASVGRLIEFKGFHHLLDALALAAREGVRVELELLGDGPWRERLESQCADLGLGSQVRLHGSVTLDEMRRTFAEVDAFVLASILDPQGASDVFPTVITEAMLCSLPVVATQLAGIPEQVIPGVTGLLVPPGDPAALAQALVSLSRDAQRLVTMGRQGRQRALQVFSQEVTLPCLQEQFARSQGREGPPPPPGWACLDFSEAAAPEGDWDAAMRDDCWVFVAGAEEARLSAGWLKVSAPRLVWMPPQAALDMEWRAQTEARERLLALWRSEAPRETEEEFLARAKPALWIAHQGGKLGEGRLLYAGGCRAARIMELVRHLHAAPLLVCGDPALAQEVRADARFDPEAPGPRWRMLRRFRLWLQRRLFQRWWRKSTASAACGRLSAPARADAGGAGA